MSSGFNFGSGLSNTNTASTGSTGFKFNTTSTTGTTGTTGTIGGLTTGTSTPFKLGGTNVASPLASSLSTTTTTPFKLGGLGGTTASTTTGTNLLGSSATNPLSTATNTLATTQSTGLTPTTQSSTASTGTASAISLSTTTPTAATTTTPTTATTTNSTLTFKLLQEYINKWMNDLDSQEKDFLNQATQLNALDKLMMENGDKIVDLSSEVDCLSTEQEQLEQELNFLFTQQSDLEESIKKLEDNIEQMPQIPQQHCDTSRIEMYKLLIEVDNQLRSQSGDLRDIIKRLNSTNVTLNDPIMQINKILNAHMDSLNWIEENTSLIQNQAENLTKTIDERMRESESSASKYSFLS